MTTTVREIKLRRTNVNDFQQPFASSGPRQSPIAMSFEMERAPPAATKQPAKQPAKQPPFAEQPPLPPPPQQQQQRQPPPLKQLPADFVPDKLPAQNDPLVREKLRAVLAERGIQDARSAPIPPASRCGNAPACNGGQTAVDLERTLAQTVIQACVTPESHYSLLGRHDVGTGKTCLGAGAAYNYAAAGRNVFWVSRSNLKSTLLDKPECFDSTPPSLSRDEQLSALGAEGKATKDVRVHFFSYARFQNFIKPSAKRVAKHKIKLLPPIPEQGDGAPPLSAQMLAERLKLADEDWLRDALLIIDEPHLMYTEGALGAEGRRLTWPMIESMILHSRRVSGKRSVALLLLTATPYVDSFANALRLLNLLPATEAERVKLPRFQERKRGSGDATKLYQRWDEFEASKAEDAAMRLLTTEAGQEELRRKFTGYVSYQGATDPTRFANLSVQVVLAPVTPVHKFAAKVPRSKLGEARDKANFDQLLQMECAPGARKPADEKARRRMAQCYFKKSALAAADRGWFPQKFKEEELFKSAPKRAEYIAFAKRVAPKAYAMYRNAADSAKKGKHFVFSGNPNANQAINAVASIFAAHGHPRVEVKLAAGNKVELKTVGNAANRGKLGAYYVVTQSASVLGGHEGAWFAAHGDKIWRALNRRPDNQRGEQVRFIILDYKFKEGVSLFDISYVHMLEKQMSRAAQQQALGRALRMCGQCGTDFDAERGWQVQAYVYDVRADRLPPFAAGYEDPEGKDKIAKNNVGGAANYKQACPGQQCIGYNEYITKALSNGVRSRAEDELDSLLRNELPLDAGFYDVPSIRTLRANWGRFLRQAAEQRTARDRAAFEAPLRFAAQFDQVSLPARVAGLESFFHAKTNASLLQMGNDDGYFVLAYRCVVLRPGDDENAIAAPIYPTNNGAPWAQKAPRSTVRNLPGDTNNLRAVQAFNGTGFALVRYDVTRSGAFDHALEFTVEYDAVLRAGEGKYDMRLFRGTQQVQGANGELRFFYTARRDTTERPGGEIIMGEVSLREKSKGSLVYEFGAEQVPCPERQSLGRAEGWVLSSDMRNAVVAVAPTQAIQLSTCSAQTIDRGTSAYLQQLAEFYSNRVDYITGTNVLPLYNAADNFTGTFLMCAAARFDLTKSLVASKPLGRFMAYLKSTYARIAPLRSGTFHYKYVQFAFFLQVADDGRLLRGTHFMLPLARETQPTAHVKPMSLSYADRDHVLLCYGDSMMSSKVLALSTQFLNAELRPVQQLSDPRAVDFMEIVLPDAPSLRAKANLNLALPQVALLQSGQHFDINYDIDLYAEKANIGKIATVANEGRFQALNVALRTDTALSKQLSVLPVQRVTAAALKGYKRVLVNYFPLSLLRVYFTASVAKQIARDLRSRMSAADKRFWDTVGNQCKLHQWLARNKIAAVPQVCVPIGELMVDSGATIDKAVLQLFGGSAQKARDTEVTYEPAENEHLVSDGARLGGDKAADAESAFFYWETFTSDVVVKQEYEPRNLLRVYCSGKRVLFATAPPLVNKALLQVSGAQRSLVNRFLEALHRDFGPQWYVTVDLAKHDGSWAVSSASGYVNLSPLRNAQLEVSGAKSVAEVYAATIRAQLKHTS